jgi:hyperosmotically inducible periplasmic protein
MFRRLLLTTLLAGTFALPAWAEIGERKNLQVLRDVTSEVRQYSRFTVFDDVNAAIEDGVVTLAGRVTMPFKRDEIAARVARVDGVREVRNELAVLPVSPFDDELRYRIARAIYGNSAFWHYAAMANPPIHIVVEHGRVTLTGVVNNNVERMLARSLATTFGAFSVKNDLKTDAEMQVALEQIRN